MEFRAAYLPQVISSDRTKQLIADLSAQCSVGYQTDFRMIQSGFAYDSENPNSNSEKLFKAIDASQPVFTALLNVVACLQHYLPGLRHEIIVVNTDRENEPWLYFALILITDATSFPASDGLTEFIDYFKKTQEMLGKQIKLFRQKPDSTRLDLIVDPNSLITKTT